jgi:DNA-binding SARP family transcriptional activator
MRVFTDVPPGRQAYREVGQTGEWPMGGPDMLRCRVLGPLEIEVDGGQVDLGGPLPRRLLSALLAAEGKPVADATLAEMVWESEPPAVLSSALQVTVSRLRSALGPTGRESLARSSAGYVFAVEPERTDAGQFVAMVAAGGQLLSAGDAARAAHAYGSALALWRGEPWSELGSTPVTTGARARLRELREIALEELQAARLASGDAAGAVAALSEAVAASPYRERRWELLVLGLYRCGRQGHALAELRRVRELLAEELGVDPGPAADRGLAGPAGRLHPGRPDEYRTDECRRGSPSLGGRGAAFAPRAGALPAGRPGQGHPPGGPPAVLVHRASDRVGLARRPAGHPAAGQPARAGRGGQDPAGHGAPGRRCQPDGRLVGPAVRGGHSARCRPLRSQRAGRGPVGRRPGTGHRTGADRYPRPAGAGQLRAPGRRGRRARHGAAGQLPPAAHPDHQPGAAGGGR